MIWAIYTSVGLWILMAGIVVAWSQEPDIVVKVLGTMVAVLFWPLMFFVGDK